MPEGREAFAGCYDSARNAIYIHGGKGSVPYSKYFMETLIGSGYQSMFFSLYNFILVPGFFPATATLWKLDLDSMNWTTIDYTIVRAI